ncbi:MAG: ThuA domain-containing protein [Phycisphaerae bacterium]|nr:ThuA domain-containing protein [Phycisphaerae bacterium]
MLRTILCVPIVSLALLALLSATATARGGVLRGLIVDGHNNHDWERTTEAMRSILSQTGRFAVDRSTAPTWQFRRGPRRPRDPAPAQLARFEAAEKAYKLEARRYARTLEPMWEGWRPTFSKYDVVVLNYNGIDWPEAVRKSFAEYVQGGGGVVLVHAANNAFRNWNQFNEMIGIGWRPEGFGVCVKVDEATGKPVHSDGFKGSGHGAKHAFVVEIRAPRHPIMEGLPARWRHGKDELYHHMRGPAKNLNVLSSAYSDPKTNGTGLHEPVTWEVAYGKGRVVVTSMGHFWPGQDWYDSLHCVGFQTILARSAEYAATGEVTIDPPKRFPTAGKTSVIPPALLRWSINGEPSSPKAKARGMAWKETKSKDFFGLLKPTDAADAMVISDGFVVEAVAAEPMVQEPVAVVWDGNGHMYVAEMRSYMQDEKGTGTKTLRNGRIKRLVDLDGDGFMDKATVFVDGLNLPRMLLPLDDRVAVVETDSTDVWSYRDTDGDGVADEKKRLYEGKQKISPTRSVEHQSSGLIWNVDNWIYTTRDPYRFRFTDGTWRDEPHDVADWMQWGLDHDDVGRLYYSANSEPVKGHQQHPLYWRLSKSRAKGRWNKPMLGPAYDASFMTMHSVCDRGDRGEDHAYRSFTSVCGQSIFRGDGLPADVYGNYFCVDPTGHVVRRARIENRNGRRVLVNATPGSEFIVSPDINFRPVNTATGPDGCLYVVDMSRGIIQDAPWVSSGPAKFMRESGLVKNIQHGRIWRVRHRDLAPGRPPQMLEESTAQLLRHLQHANGWWRDSAQRLILLRPDRAVVSPALKAMVRFDGHALARMHALWTLEGMDGVDPALLLEAFGDRDARVRATAIRISEPWIREGDPPLLDGLEVLADDRDLDVVHQLILSLGWSEDERAIRLIERAVEANLTHEGVYLAAMTVLYGRETPLIKRMVDGSAFKKIRDPSQRINTQRRWQTGIARWKKNRTPARPLDPEAVSLIERGERIYNQTCIACHGQDGRGVTPPGAELALAPSLVASPRVAGQRERLIRILLHGLTGPIDDRRYEAGMMVPGAALGLNDDQAIAAVLSYIRQDWGNMSSVIRPRHVATTREAAGKRVTPWTLGELDGFALPELPDRSAWQADSSAGRESAARAIAEDRRSCDNPNRPGRWFLVDLASAHVLSQVVLDAGHHDRYPRGFEVRVSPDGQAWSEPVAIGTGAGSITAISFEPVTARFVKIIQTGESSHHRWSIAELKVHGRRVP